MGIKLMIQKVFNFFGYQIEKLKSENEVVSGGKDDLINNLLRLLNELNFNPERVVDIGAHKGDWTRLLLNHFSHAKVLMIEPQKLLSENFKDLKMLPNIEYLPIGVGGKSGVLNFTIHERPDSCSFLYSEEEAQKLGLVQEQIEVRSLNDIYQNTSQEEFPDLVKIDAEGLDLEVLEGATCLFGITEVFLVEATVYSGLYKNSVKKVIDYMDSKGYELFDLTDLNRPFDVKILWLVELVFVKKNGYLSDAFVDNL